MSGDESLSGGAQAATAPGDARRVPTRIRLLTIINLCGAACGSGPENINQSPSDRFIID